MTCWFGHRLEEQARRFTAPNAKWGFERADLEDAQKLAWGFTTVEQRCTACGALHFHEVVGDQRPEADRGTGWPRTWPHCFGCQKRLANEIISDIGKPAPVCVDCYAIWRFNVQPADWAGVPGAVSICRHDHAKGDGCIYEEPTAAEIAVMRKLRA